MCGPGGCTHAPPRPPWAAVAALLALGFPHDPALDYTYLTLRMTLHATLRYATLRYAAARRRLLVVARCCCSALAPAAAAPVELAGKLRPLPRLALPLPLASPTPLLRLLAAATRAARCCAACPHPFKNLRHQTLSRVSSVLFSFPVAWLTDCSRVSINTKLTVRGF